VTTAVAIRSGVLATVLALGSSGSAWAQKPVSVFNGASLDGWIVEHAKADAESAVLAVRSGPGWVRHSTVLADFILRTDVRLIGPDAAAALYVRAWPTFNAVTKMPGDGYSVSLRQRSAAAGGPVEEWRRLELECRGRLLIARIDGNVVYTSEEVRNPQGYVALAVSGGTAEFRNITVARVPLPRPKPIGDALVMGPGIRLPEPLSEVKPQYTRAAMIARIEGAALLEVVVKADGTVGDVTVVQSLDPRYGLDREAREAAQQWRFRPGTKDGQPVAVVVMIELTFTLK
jgi:TonB family protein